MKKQFGVLAVFAAAMFTGASGAFAAADPLPTSVPLDLTGVGTLVAGFVPLAAGTGLVVAVALMGARVIKKALGIGAR